MVRIVASELALRVALCLGQAPRGLLISELARALEEPFSSVDRALEVLASDEVAERHGHRYFLTSGPRSEAVVRMAVAFLEPSDILASASKGNRAVEFCGQDEQGLVLVTRRFADPVDEASLARLLDLLRDTRGTHVEVLDKGALRDRLTTDQGLRRRALRMRVLAGSVDRSFPDRSRHGDPQARPLGTLHPSLDRPSQRRLRDLARRYKLQRVEAFGSATRTDLRPDSDVDLLVEACPGHRLRIGEVVRLTSEAEDLFGRDVDLLMGPLAPEPRARLARDAVVLYDAGR